MRALHARWLLVLLASGCHCVGRDPAVEPPPTAVEEPASEAPPEERPGVVLLTVDSLRRDAMGPATPALARLSRDGTHFERARSPAPWAMPSIATLSTSLSPERHGATASEATLTQAVWTLAEHLRCAGFETASFYANGYLSGRFGFDQGWDHHTNAIRENGPSEAEAVLSAASAWIEAHRGGPFFVHVHLIDPHLPYRPPEAFLPPGEGPLRPAFTHDRLEADGRQPVSVEEADWLRALYAAEVASVDAAFGPFRDALPEQTLLVLSASDGEVLGEQGRWGGDDGPAARSIPLVFVGPGIARDRAWDLPVGLIDVAPTILSLVGAEPSPRFEGRSLAPLLRPDAPADAQPGPARRSPVSYAPGTPSLDYETCLQMVRLGYVDLGGLSEEAYCRREAARTQPDAPSAPCAG